MTALQRPLQVGQRTELIIGWVCVVFFSVPMAISFLSHDYGLVLGFAVFCGLGLYVILSAGRYGFDDDTVTHHNAFGAYRMAWKDVTSIEFSIQGTLVLHGAGKRLSIHPPGMWSGPDKPEAYALLSRKVKETGLTPQLGDWADYKSHKGVRIPR